jgi:membrane protease subunit HflC
MQAYETGLGHSDTRMVLKPDSEFFRYFVDPSGRSAGSPPQQPTQQLGPASAPR